MSDADEPANEPLEWLEAERTEQGSRVEFQRQLADCTEQLVRLGTEVAKAILPVTVAFLEADSHVTDAYESTDRWVSAQCRVLEDACYLLLARQSPVAGDLRRVVATIRCISDVERSSSLLRHVGESLAWVHPPSMPGDIRETLGDLGRRSAEVFSRGVDAWRTLDGLAAIDLDQADDDVDLLQKVLLTEIYTGKQSVEESVSLALLARYFERISDHGVEMARQVSYVVTGERVSDERSAD